MPPESTPCIESEEAKKFVAWKIRKYAVLGIVIWHIPALRT